MLINGQPYRTIWLNENNDVVIIDQRFLPFKVVFETIASVNSMITAIKDMHLRGAGLIGVAAAYGVYLAVKETKGNYSLFLEKINKLIHARPTASNLKWAIDFVLPKINKTNDFEKKLMKAKELAEQIANDDVEMCNRIGKFGLELIRKAYIQKHGKTVNILTHCNAGWLAFTDIGTATAPIYQAAKENIPIHVWVDETRPRNQGAFLTAWELSENNIPHTVIADNTGGHLMQHGLVDMVIVGTDRTTSTGDVANKIGTYLKALAAFDNKVPFYVALPYSSIDWNITNGLSQIIIEERSEEELKYIEGINNKGKIEKVTIVNPVSKCLNYAFDVTPSRLITAFITDKGICYANELKKLYHVKNQ